MYTIEELTGLLRKEIDKNSYVESPETLFEPIKYMLQDGGKMIRPLLALIAYNMYSDDISEALTPAIGIEIFHNYTLLHDDVMDDAELRRGRPTVHKKWNVNVAILSGDAAAITAYKCIGLCKDQYLRAAIDNFNQVAMDVCKGQQYDMEFETREYVTTDEYLQMIHLKTAVLLAGCLRHGALIAGAPEEEYQALYNFGCCIGMLFQLQDDYLDVYGDVKTLGKNIGGDILENKKTYMLIKARELADSQDKKELEMWISKKDFNPSEKIKAVKAIYDRVGVPTIVKDILESYSEKSIQILGEIKLPNEKKQPLYRIIRMLEGRRK
ncbi:MAG: polyprenyl synthetase family protein [Culturomica sp.]|jgi:geranylgeranyl diphosphate synthase type II|nr:polyprenyl synthetase family protein [Culturomica sp.]